MSTQWQAYLLSLTGAVTTGFAPTNAQYWVSTANTDLTNERNFGALSTGFVFITVGAGVATPSSTLNGAQLANLTGANITGGGVYTPTLTAITNVSAATAYQCQYSRVGAFVTVSGMFDVDPTAAGAAELAITVPIASNFTAPENCGGTAFAPAVAGMGAAIQADAANNWAAAKWVAVDTANRTMAFTFSYLVL